MTIRYQPKAVLKRMASKKNVKKIVTKKLTINKAALNAIESSGVVGKKQLEVVALKVIKQYKARAKDGEKPKELAEDPKRLVQQIQNVTVREITLQVREQYYGEYYTWLPSSADVPDPKHRKKYGKRYQIGKGEMPGDRIGCRCGMEIHVPESRLVLE